ncbi:hypothetical protein FOMA001_g17442 [Fusarium oxysporum f. sp. matthiolae]|nr:hypothetical protein FOMA001_g17442 [Fusarium oxysporum f. sp. matthiolae]
MGKNEVSSFQPSSRPIAANERTIEQQKAQGDRKHIHKSNEYWVAFILEIRASDDDHVYARVYWMYWPEDLPRGTHDGKKKVQSRQPYHGANEVTASVEYW